tara:strand:+ start:1840 stop:2004 length:165 start_codon:yes stop_codon:yes gene_type:complete
LIPLSFLEKSSLFNVGNSTELLRWNKKASYVGKQTRKVKGGKLHLQRNKKRGLI